MRGALLRVALVSSAALSACAAPPKQYGGLVPIDGAGLEQRLGALCRFGLAPEIEGSAELVDPCGRP